MGEGHGEGHAGARAAVGAFERVLMRRHRLELSALALRLEAVVCDLEALDEQQQRITEKQAATAGQDFASSSEPLARTLAALQARVPSFLGEQELQAFTAACRAFVASFDDVLHAGDEKLGPESKDWVSAMEKRAELLSGHVEELDREAKRAAPVTSLATDKRNHFIGFLDDAALLLERSHAHRLAELQVQMTELLESYRRALLDPAVSKRKQLEFEMSTIETSALTMLLPHLEICRTIVTANAEVRSNASRFTSSECGSISTFVKTAIGLKDRTVEFSSLAKRSTEFVKQLELFERAASKDAFLVCSTALKLQFQESLDKELFLAYLNDWNAKQALLRDVIKSAAYVDAVDRTAALKQQIVSLDGRIRDGKASVAVDEPTRAALEQEIARLFEREGGATDGLQLF